MIRRKAVWIVVALVAAALLAWGIYALTRGPAQTPDYDTKARLVENDFIRTAAHDVPEARCYRQCRHVGAGRARTEVYGL